MHFLWSSLVYVTGETMVKPSFHYDFTIYSTHCGETRGKLAVHLALSMVQRS